MSSHAPPGAPACRPSGIEPSIVKSRLGSSSVQETAARMAQALSIKGRTVLGGVEWLSSMQGIAIKLMAFESLLENYPKYRGDVTLLQVGVPVIGRGSDVDADVAGACREIALRIRQRFGAASLHYMEVGFTPSEGQPATSALDISAADWCVSTRVAVWTLLDVLVVTATRDGLNLLPFEYVCARRLQGGGGVCVLSEFAGCSRVLNGAIRVNPFSLTSVVEAMDRALSLDRRDACARMVKDWAFLDAHTTSSWVQLFVKDLKRVRAPSGSRARGGGRCCPARPVAQPSLSRCAAAPQARLMPAAVAAVAVATATAAARPSPLLPSTARGQSSARDPAPRLARAAQVSIAEDERNESVLGGELASGADALRAPGLPLSAPLPRKLEVEPLVRAYRAASRRVFCFGLDGTLIPQVRPIHRARPRPARSSPPRTCPAAAPPAATDRPPSGVVAALLSRAPFRARARARAQDTVITHLKENHDFVGRGQAPSPAVLHCLRALASDPSNEVHVLSGRGSSDMAAILGSFERLGLAAELGYLRRAPGGSTWERHAHGADSNQ